MLHSTYQAVLGARDRPEYRDIVVRFSKKLGFDLVAAVAVLDREDGRAEFFAIENAPEDYRDRVNDPKEGRQDPVMQHCKHRSTPIIWDQSTYLEAGRIEKWEEQAQFGYRTGIRVALHLPEKRHFVVGVERDQALPQDRTEFGRMLANPQLFAVYAQESALRVLVPPVEVPQPPPRLAAQEIDCLRWTMEGRSSWEVGEILHVAESTVHARVESAMRKLSCAT